MAKLHEEIIVIKVSKLLRDSESSPSGLLDQQALDSLEAVIQELAGSNILVEIHKQ